VSSFLDFFNYRNSLSTVSDYPKLFFKEFVVVLDSVEITFEIGIETCEFEVHANILTVNKPIMGVSFLLAVNKIFGNQLIFYKNDFFWDSLIIRIVSFDITRKHEL